MKVVVAFVNLAAVVGAGALLAAIAGDVAGAELHAPVASPSSPTATAGVTRRERAPDGVDAIVRRNVFFHGETPPGEGGDEGTAAPPAPSGEGCSLAIDVGGAVLVRGAPSLSLATIRDAATGTVAVVQVGDEIAPGATLASVVVDGDGALVGIDVARDGRRERCLAVPRAVLAAGAAPPASVAGGATHAVVAESEVRAMLGGGWAALASQIRALPVVENGAITGFRLSNIPRDSIAARAGLADGDVVTRVNGYALASAEDALRLTTLLKNERDLSVDVVRGGRPVALEVAIR